jgi:predicted RND superfamily exporter protein
VIINTSTNTDKRVDISLVDPMYAAIGQFRVGIGHDLSIYMTREEMDSLFYEVQAAIVEYEMEIEHRANNPI